MKPKQLSFVSIFLLFLLQFFPQHCFCQIGLYPDIEWEKSFGGSDADFGRMAHPTSGGGFICIGTTYSDDGDVSTNNGMTDIWAIKLDSLRNIIWQQTFGGTWWEYCESIVEIPDGFILAGSTVSHDGDIGNNYGDWYVDYWDLTSDLWVIKLDSFGTLVWEQNYGGWEDESASDILYSDDGGFIIVGGASSYDQDVEGCHGGLDGWIIKIDSIGNLIWQNTIGGSEDDYFFDMSQTLDGGFVVCGKSYSNDFDLTENNGESDAWVVKLDSNGEIAWQNSLGGSQHDIFESIVQTATGYIAVGHSGSSDGDLTEHFGQPDYWLVNLDTLGNLVWQVSLGGTEWDVAESVVETTDGYLIVGYSESADFNLEGIGDAEGAVWLIKIDFDGNIISNKTLGGSSWDHAEYIELLDDGGCLVQALSTSIDGQVTGNHGYIDYWLIKLKPECYHNRYFSDNDGDGFGNVLVDSFSCDLISGFVTDSADCDDANYLMNPLAMDICNTIDDNCNDLIDEDALFITYFLDVDGDNYGNPSIDSISCYEIAGYVPNSSDCNDADIAINPDATEVCNDIDDNCNALIDEGLPLYTFYADADDDTFGNIFVTATSCHDFIAGYVSDSTDCDDSNAAIYPGAEEICNYLDDDCNGTIDDNLSYIHSYEDADGDTYGNVEVDSLACVIPDGYVEDDTDCDDTDPAIYPGAPELLNNLDDNCNELIDEGLSVDNELMDKIKIYPNPVEDILQIIYAGNEIIAIEIINLTSETVAEVMLSGSTGIDVHLFAPGIYLLKVKSDNAQAVFPFIKE